MKKLLITLLMTITILSGCSITKVENNGINEILNTILYNDNNLSNTFMTGYEFYLPKGLQIVDKKDYNLKIKDHDCYYYLYVDTVLYYYKVENEFVENNNHFYSKKFIHNGKIGYIDIFLKDDNYFIALMYNYSKIECYVLKQDLERAIVNMSYILSTVKYNDSVISKSVSKEKFISQESKFNLFETEKENDNFLKYEEEYGTYKETIVVNKDNDILDVEDVVD